MCVKERCVGEKGRYVSPTVNPYHGSVTGLMCAGVLGVRLLPQIKKFNLDA